VNVFGFPAAAGALGNPGLTDIRLVVEWVRDNIEGFGYVRTHHRINIAMMLNVE
jgi:hypothetical protein